MAISVARAEKIILAHVPRVPAGAFPLREAPGRVLREPLKADRDLPPFDRATLDGIAVCRATWAGGRREFRIVGFQPAGTPPARLDDPATGIEIATGAPLPRGCDTVIPFEDITVADGVARVRPGLRCQRAAGQGVHRRGSDARRDAVLVAAGVRIGPAEIGIAAAVGRTTMRVAMRPEVAVVTTGDELVEIGARPAPHQIRRTNDSVLRALLERAGCNVACFHVPDDERRIARLLRRLVDRRCWLVVCGGISKGRLDLVPGTLDRLGVVRHFQGVAQRPGKPSDSERPRTARRYSRFRETRFPL